MPVPNINFFERASIFFSLEWLALIATHQILEEKAYRGLGGCRITLLHSRVSI